MLTNSLGKRRVAERNPSSCRVSYSRVCESISVALDLRLVEVSFDHAKIHQQSNCMSKVGINFSGVRRVNNDEVIFAMNRTVSVDEPTFMQVVGKPQDGRSEMSKVGISAPVKLFWEVDVNVIARNMISS